jgi:hypothetical protein
MSKLRTWLLRIGSAVIGFAAFVLGALFKLYPSDTTLVFATWFRVSNITIVSWIIIGVVIALSVTAIIIVLVIIAERFGWIASFEAEIVGKTQVLPGENLQFKASYKGKLKNGLFTCKVFLPNDRETWWPAPDTFIHTEKGDVGTLSGSKEYEFTWLAPVPENFPTGKFTACVGVYEWETSKPRKEKRLTFYVVDPRYNQFIDMQSPLRGILRSEDVIGK